MTVDAQEMVDRIKEKPITSKYNKLNYDVASINEQIHELLAAHDANEGDIDVWESQIKSAMRANAKIDKQLERLRQKRDIVAEAAFKAARLDQP